MTVSKSELWTQYANMCHLVNEVYQFGEKNTPNFVTLYSTLQESFEGNHIANTQASITNMRDALNSCWSNAYNGLQSILLELAKVGYSSIQTTISGALDDIFDGMTSGSETIKNRAYTYASSPTAGGSNVGSGTVYRCTEDENGQNIESGYTNAGTMKIECTEDKNTGRTSGQERFVVYGSGITPVDAMEQQTARPNSLTISAKDAPSTILQNPSFENENGETGADLSVTNWTLDTVTNFSINTGTSASDRFRPSSIVTNSGKCLQFEADSYASQWIAAGGKSFDPTKKYIMIVRYKTTGTVSTGTLTIHLGSKSANVSLAGGIANWTDLVVGGDDDGYYNNFKNDDSNQGVLIKIDVSSLTGTTPIVQVDHIILSEMDVFDGVGVLVASGATDFLRGDYYTYSDSTSNTGEMQTMTARFFNRHLPHTSGTPTYADAT